MSRTLLTVITTLCVAGCAAEEPPAEAVLRPVRSQAVEPAGTARERIFSGVAVASIESQLSFRVGGTVTRVAVEVGDRVRAGQIIAELDPTDLQLELESSQAALDQAQASRRNADANFDRARELYENNNASQNEYDAARAQAESATAGVDSAQKQLQLARLRLGYATLRASIAGAIAAVDVDANENVSAGSVVAMLTSGSQPEVRVAIPENLISRVERGSRVDVEFDALPGRRLTATVTEVGVAALGTATTFPVTARLDVDVPEVRSGMAAEVRFRFGEDGSADTLLVPLVAVGEDRQGRFVFVLEASGEGRGLVRRRQVTLGEIRGTGVEVLSGLRAGERIVTAGLRRLTDGQEVRLADTRLGEAG